MTVEDLIEELRRLPPTAHLLFEKHNGLAVEPIGKEVVIINHNVRSVQQSLTHQRIYRLRIR
jgi:hypothetical protein